ncbi:MAG: peptidoglycan editing factor PgeF [Halothiobacillus sp.]
MTNNIELIIPNWCAPPGVHACTTTRLGGVSAAPFHTLNLATHVQDAPPSVIENRRRLKAALALPAEPFWLNQVHGITVANPQNGALPDADAAFTDQPDTVLAILTADCLSVVFARKDGGEIAAAHAGWRGLAAGILEATLAKFSAPPDQIAVWLGPAIGPAFFEVGEEVRDAFVRRHPADAAGFTPSPIPGKYQADLFQLAQLKLLRAGVRAISGGGRCTFSESDRLFSYRKDQGHTGRMATLIWRSEDGSPLQPAQA